MEEKRQLWTYMNQWGSNQKDGMHQEALFCVCACVHVRGWVLIIINTYRHMCRGRRSSSQPFLRNTLFWDKSSLAWSSPLLRWDWLASKPQKFCLHHSSPGVPGMHHHTQLFHMGSRVQSQIFMLALASTLPTESCIQLTAWDFVDGHLKLAILTLQNWWVARCHGSLYSRVFCTYAQSKWCSDLAWLSEQISKQMFLA